MSKNSISQKERYKNIAEDVLKSVGGASNVSNVTHCMTRLRFNLKDKSIPDKDKIQNISGVIGVIEAGGQFQVIIGQTVDKVYEAVCELGNFKIEKNIEEAKSNESKPKGIAGIGNNILNNLAGCLTPLIPLLMAASIFKLLAAVLGPSMLNVIAEGSDLYTLFTFVGDAGFYFLPVVVGYTAAKKFGVTPMIGMFMGGILIHPTFVAMVSEGAKFTVYGIPCSVQNYSSSILPIILTVWIMSYVERFFKKYTPATLRTIFAPALTMLVILPVSLCVLSPAEAFLGNYICTALLSLSEVGGIFGILAIAIIGAIYEFLVMSGMHLVLISTLILVFSTNGFEGVVTPAACAASIAVAGMTLGVALRMRNKEERSLSIGYLVASIIGGVTEPALYGIGMKYKRPFVGMMIGGFAGGLYAGIVGLKAYAMVPVASFLCLFSFAGGPTSDLINGVITGVISFVVAAVATYFIGYENKTVKAKEAEVSLN